MSIFFDFSPSETTVNIKLALTYHPKITVNEIKERRYNAFLYVLAGSYRYTFSGKEFTAEQMASLLMEEYGIDMELALKDSKALCQAWTDAGVAE